MITENEYKLSRILNVLYIVMMAFTLILFAYMAKDLLSKDAEFKGWFLLLTNIFVGTINFYITRKTITKYRAEHKGI